VGGFLMTVFNLMVLFDFWDSNLRVSLGHFGNPENQGQGQDALNEDGAFDSVRMVDHCYISSYILVSHARSLLRPERKKTNQGKTDIPSNLKNQFPTNNFETQC
jgi:hypothetical protein